MRPLLADAVTREPTRAGTVVLMHALELPDRPFTRCELPDLGITPWQLRQLLDNRDVRRVLKGVYVGAAVPDSIETRATAAALVVTEAAVLCDRTAAWLHGVDVLRYRELDILPPLETFVLRGRNRVTRGECRGGERNLSPADIQVVRGVRVTTPLRTALDLGCLLRRQDALAALDAFMRIHLITQTMLRSELPRYRRRRGVVQLRQLVAVSSPLAESPRESWVRLAILDSNLPAPTLQFWVTEHGVPIFRLDHAYPRAKIAVEYDGELHHDQTDEQRAADQRRRAWLRERGWTIIVVTRWDFLDGRVEWLSELRLALQLAD